jgi:DNA polymerase
MDIYTIDLETYYAKDFSLTKLTTEEYVNDPRFEVIGLAIKKNQGTTQWYSGDEVEWFLNKFDFSDSMIVCHNTMFDAAILAWRYKVNPKVWADTMSMARFVHGVHGSVSLATLSNKYGVGVKGTEVNNALGKRRQDFCKDDLARYAEYCINDVDLTYEIFTQMIGGGFPKKELKIIDLTLRMFIDPVLEIDQGLLALRLKEIRVEKQRALASIKERLRAHDEEEVRKTLASNKQFASLLTSYNIKVPMKPSPVNPENNIPALGKKDAGFIDLQKNEDEFIQLLCSVRLGTKSTMEEGRVENFMEIASRNNGKLPIPLNYCGAHTSRWSGKDRINLQNLPSRDPKKKALKNSIVAPPGHLIIDCDSSQIEARVLAWLAEQNDVIEAFANKQDVYRLMGAAIYKKEPEEITKDERFLSKTVVLGCGFGTGWKKLQAELKSAGVEKDDATCKSIISIYRDKNFKIVEMWDEANAALMSMIRKTPYRVGKQDCLGFEFDGIRLPSGYKIYYPGLDVEAEQEKLRFFYQSRKGKEGLWYGTLIENMVQGLARCIVSEQMLLISKRYRPVLTVHDAVAIVVPENEKDEAVAFVESCMSHAPKWAAGCPIACESGVGYSYGDC